MTSSELRESFLAYFEGLGHRRVPSSPLVPHDDPTLLFTNAGMNQFKDVFLGRENARLHARHDLAEVHARQRQAQRPRQRRPLARHHTFFEMLGNFSFGDYFKEDAIAFAWELLTKVWEIPTGPLVGRRSSRARPASRATTRRTGVWQDFVPADRIHELGTGDNFWPMGETGPCGPCSEIHYFRGNDALRRRCATASTCDCDRCVEIWNLVFMQFDRAADGTLLPLPAPSIDTGIGLERVTAVLQGKQSNYDTDVFVPILAAIGRRGRTSLRRRRRRRDVSMRVIADHCARRRS